MNRRHFLKSLVGVTAVLFVPKIAIGTSVPSDKIVSTKTLVEMVKGVNDQQVNDIVQNIISVNPMYESLPFVQLGNEVFTYRRRTLGNL